MWFFTFYHAKSPFKLNHHFGNVVFYFFVQPPLSNSEKTYSMVIDQLQSLDVDVGRAWDLVSGYHRFRARIRIRACGNPFPKWLKSNGRTIRSPRILQVLGWSIIQVGYTPEDEHGTCPHGGLVQIIFLSFHGWFVGSTIIFQGVASKSSKHLRLSMVWPVALMPCKPSPMPTPSRYPG